MGEWKESTLGDVSIDGGHYGIAASAVPLDASLPTYLRITDIRDDGTINKSGLTSVDDPNSVEYILSPNDLVIARTGASTGRNYFYDGRDGELVYAGFLIKFSIDPNKIYPQYVKYWFLSPFYKAWLNSHTDGSTRANINAVTLADCPIRFPADLPTQRRIAAVLGALDDKIEVNRKICENLEAQAQALFKAWFVDFEPFGGKRPEGWKMGKLGDVADCNQRSYSAKDAWPEVSYLDTGSITKNVIAEVQLLPMDKAPSRARRKVRQYSIVYSTVRPNLCHYGIIADVKENMLVSTGFAVVDAKEGYSPFHAYLALTSEDVTKELHALAEQSVCTYPALNPEDVMAVDILIPTLDIEKQFDNLVRPMFDLVEKKSQETRILAAMRDALLPKLMSGELAVEKVEGV